MARVTPQGIEPTTLPQYIERLNEAFRTALGNDLDFAPETPQGQLVGQIALLFTQQDEALVAVANGNSPQRAIGIQLDDLGSLLDIPRLRETHSTVTATLTGTEGTVIPQSARAQTTAGDVFATTAETTIGTEGSATATMRAVGPGPVPALAGALSEMVDLIVGWTAVTNAADAILGSDVERDVGYRRRYGRQLARNARSSTEAVLAAVLAVEGVEDAIIRENATSAAVAERGKTIDANSICVVVDGGSDADVGAAIVRTKTAGTGTSGDTIADVPYGGGSFVVPVRFSRVALVPLSLTITTTFGSGFPSDGTEQIIMRAVDWFAGNWRSGADDFDTSGVGIGEHLDTNRLLTPIQSVPGHSVTNIAVARKTALVGSRLTGGEPDDLSALQTITDGALTFEGASLTGLDFSTATSFDDVASALQTALRVANVDKVDDAIVSYAADVFTITLGFDTTGAPYGIDDYASGDSADDLGFTEADGASIELQIRNQDVSVASGVTLAERLTINAEDITIV